MRRSKGQLLLWLVVVAVVFWAGNRLSEAVRDQYAAHVPVTEIAGALPHALTQDVWRVSTDRVDLIVGAVAVGMLLLIALYRLSGRANTRPGEEQGSAAWGSSRDIAPLSDRSEAKRLDFTRSEALSIDTRRTGRNLNVLVLGASGTGKTRSYVLPNLATVEMSTAVTDPKGEIFKAAAGGLQSRGYAVRVFNLIDLHRSDHFNPMAYFDPEQPETSIVQLTETIMLNTSGERVSGDGFWERAERALLTSLVAFVWATTAESTTTQPSLVDVVDLQKQMAASESKSDQFKSDVDLQFEAAQELVDEWAAGSDHDDPEQEQVMNVLDFACRQYRVFTQGAGETKKGIIISLGVRLAPLDMHDLRAVMADDTIALDTIGLEPAALFLEIPDTHTTFRFVAAMFWQCLFAANVYLADHEEAGTLPIPVHCYLDEFANIGKIPSFPQVVSTIRSRGLSASIIVQAFSQGKALWRDDWATIVSNCDTVLYLGGRDAETTKWLSEQIGDETVTSEETSRSYGMSGQWTRSQRLVKRQLMTPDEIARMPNEQAIVLIRGLRPFRSAKARMVTQAA